MIQAQREVMLPSSCELLTSAEPPTAPKPTRQQNVTAAEALYAAAFGEAAANRDGAIVARLATVLETVPRENVLLESVSGVVRESYLYRFLANSAEIHLLSTQRVKTETVCAGNDGAETLRIVYAVDYTEDRRIEASINHVFATYERVLTNIYEHSGKPRSLTTGAEQGRIER